MRYCKTLNKGRVKLRFVLTVASGLTLSLSEASTRSLGITRALRYSSPLRQRLPDVHLHESPSEPLTPDLLAWNTGLLQLLDHWPEFAMVAPAFGKARRALSLLPTPSSPHHGLEH